jgi:hypothetical protein
MTSDPSHAQPNPEDEDSDAELDQALAELTAGPERAEPLDRHDPQNGPDRPWTVGSFNTRLLGIPSGMLYLPPT